MIVHIEDDFDLEKIEKSGQCFRVTHGADGIFRFITGRNLLFIKACSATEFEVSCSYHDWTKIWIPYFDLERNYAALRSMLSGRNPFIDRCMNHGKGLRILRQDPWEMMITFIISQRKSIPAIAKSISLLCDRFGDRILDQGEQAFSFPSPESLAYAAAGQLSECALGYRVPYVEDAAGKVVSGELDIESLKVLSDELLIEKLKGIHGVGNKVANCIALFGYGRSALAPVDVWIQRAINDECCGINPFNQYHPWGGIMQQYVFYYQKHRPMT